MAHVTDNNNEFTDAKEAANTKKKNPMAFMSWEMVNKDGSPLLKGDGKPYLASDGNADLPIFGIKGYGKSKAEEKLIQAAKAKQELDEELELTLRVKIKYYDPTPKEDDIDDDELFDVMFGS